MRKSMALLRFAIAVPLMAAAFQVQVPAAQSVECTEGGYKVVTTGPMCSCDGTRTPKDRYQCINGEWVYVNSLCGPPFCQGGGGGGDCGPATPGSCAYGAGYVCPAYCYCCY